jgi:histidinol-phosphate aminotransferase
VIIDANENPLGPCSVAREAIADITSDSGRYSFCLTEDLAKRFAEQQGLKPEYVRAFPGSGEPLHFSVLAFTSTARRYATADPGYEAGMHAAKISGARVVKTPLASSYAHDVKAMLGAASNASCCARMFSIRPIQSGVMDAIAADLLTVLLYHFE